MRPKPVRPQPGQKVGDATEARETRLQNQLQSRVEQCFTQPPDKLQFLVALDKASVKTALFDIWSAARENPALRNWAAAQMAALGDPSLQAYDAAGEERS